MNKEMQDISQDMGRLTEDARVLIAATVDMAGKEVGEARKRLTKALKLGKGNLELVRQKVIQGDEAAHEHPYPLIGIGVGIGAILGFLITGRWGCSRS